MHVQSSSKPCFCILVVAKHDVQIRSSGPDAKHLSQCLQNSDRVSVALLLNEVSEKRCAKLVLKISNTCLARGKDVSPISQDTPHQLFFQMSNRISPQNFTTNICRHGDPKTEGEQRIRARMAGEGGRRRNT